MNYSSLWASCDKLRGGMDASQYKDYILTLLFVKYVTDKFKGVKYADITVELNLNLRNVTDAYVFRVFKEWQKINYDLKTGARVLMKDYIAPYLLVKEANRDGTVWREVKFQKVMMTSVTGLDGLDYTNNEARKLSVKFRSDIWTEDIQRGIAAQ